MIPTEAQTLREWLDEYHCSDTVNYVLSHQNSKDPINPPHYTSGGIETIDYIEAKLGEDGVMAFCLGNVIKYVSRAGKKDMDKEVEDLKKALWYLNKAIEVSSK
jgi:hypothetical protein